MEIKTQDGTYSVASNGQANLNTVLGALGTASFLGWGGNGGGFYGGGMGNSVNSSNPYVTKDTLQMSVELAKKESEIARLMADKETDKKLADVFKAAADRDVIFRDRLEAQYRELDKKITEEREARMMSDASQSVLNSQFQTGITILKEQTKSMQAVLADITTSVIPARKVCDTGCGCGCGN